ncbi:MAG: phosphatidate cytidylyltransferase [Anaerolineae bacterium]|nr:phosphatidate cytidylyltransferase [Anaerolineae bacterium]
MADWLAIAVSFLYVFLALGVAEALRKWRGYSVDFTRKFIHIAVGMWAYGTVLLFKERSAAIVPPLAFVAINALSYRAGMFKAMETGEKGRFGTIYFPISFAAVIWLLWDRPHLVVASLMPMTWGDALAAIVGRRAGKHHYTIGGNRRSVEGSVAMFLAGWLATFPPLLLLAHPPLSTGLAVGVSALTALGAAVVEALSPWGIDNLTVPAASALVLVLSLR